MANVQCKASFSAARRTTATRASSLTLYLRSGKTTLRSQKSSPSYVITCRPRASQLISLPRRHAGAGMPKRLISHLSSLGSSDLVDVNEDVTFCVATKDHPDDLFEFFTHHYRRYGVRRFYIMDDGSAVLLSTFKDFRIPRSSISFHYFDDKAKADVGDMHTHIYSECIDLSELNLTFLSS